MLTILRHSFLGDVVKFNKSQLTRFKNDVKQFWSISLHLFHAKFMRFMGVGLLYGDSNMTMGKLDRNWRSKCCTDKDWFAAMSVSSRKMLDELAQDNSISAIIKQTPLHYHQDFATLSSIFCYFIIKTWLQFWQDFVTLSWRLCYSIHYYHQVCVTHFYWKYNCNRIFPALTHHTTKFITYI